MVDDEGSERVFPLVEEEFSVTKRQVESDRVRVRVSTDSEQATAMVTLHSERVEIEHVPVGREVKNAPSVREENGVTIIPVLEEAFVVEKRLILKEELHVRRVTTVTNTEQPVELRRQRVEVERLPPASADRGQDALQNAGGAEHREGDVLVPS